MYTLPDPLPFYRIVWEIVRQIPYAQVATYGQIASMIAPPSGIEAEDYDKLGPRWVGDAMNNVSRVDEPTVPWHRVINSRGGISMADDNPASALQRARLRHEGVVFGAKELIDLNDFGWDGPDAAWLKEHGLFAPRPIKKKPDDDAPKQLSLF